MSAGVYTVYELVDQHIINPVPSISELNSYFEDMKSSDQAVQNISDTLNLMLGSTRAGIITLQ
jgi:hypothetical protein